MSGKGWQASAGCRVERHLSVTSTNTLALERARAGDRGPLWIVAGEQTAGRGRHGRHWRSPSGNLYASRLIVAPPPPARLAGLAFVAAIAVHDAVSPWVPDEERPRLCLKWPNDLMVGAGKLAGILVEVEQVGAGVAAAVGIGINIAAAPEEASAATLAGLGADCRADDLFDHLGVAFEKRLAEWDDGRGFAATRDAWLARAMPSGTPTSVRTGSDRIDGRFRGLADDGAMLVELEGGVVRQITSGEVFMSSGGR